MWFNAASTFTCSWLFVALLRLGCGQDIVFPSDKRFATIPMRNVNVSTGRSPSMASTETPTSTKLPANPNPLQASSAGVKHSCLAPPQPAYGEWKLHPDLCKESNADCKVPEGTALELGSELVYTCPAGYRGEGTTVVYCRHNQKWSRIPDCVGTECSALNSVERSANCIQSDKTVNCDLPVPPRTQAELFCRPGYERVGSSLTRSNNYWRVCQEDGQWEPPPFECKQVCGRAITHQTPLIAGGFAAKVGDFPWHASVYMQRNSLKGNKTDFLCGATIISTNFLLTAAHCVYDEVLSKPQDPKTLFIKAGSIYIDYDIVWNSEIPTKAAVKKVHISPRYLGLQGNYASDIALLELEQPLVLSEILLPVCLDNSGNSGVRLKSGVIGKIAGFGRTSTNQISNTLQTTTVPYVSIKDCLDSAAGSLSAENTFLVTPDKFCAGYTNGSAICEGDSGAGLVFRENDRWYVMGIASVGLGVAIENGERACDKKSYNLYTQISHYMDWIQQVISNQELHEAGTSTTTRSPTPPLPQTTQSSIARSPCLAPPQPINGQWKGHPSLCFGDTNCTIPQGTRLEPGSQLVYSCNEGYEPRVQTDVYCKSSGRWSSLPICSEIRCRSPNSPSISADCKNQTGGWISCDPSVPPQAWASLSCRLGYTEYTAITTQAHRVSCNGAGQWEPEPIRCVPDCGKAITQQTPYVINGTSPRTGEFPWHASIYVERRISKSNETMKQFICGATIIQTNLLLTAAHCVYDADSGVEQDPKKLFIMTGNVFRDYDYSGHSSVAVRKRAVKNVYRHCSYHGKPGAYASDIALIELQEPFKLSKLLVPACLYPDGHDEQILDHGGIGKVAGFGRTNEGPFSSYLQTITVPYIPYHECKTSVTAEKNKFLISDDKFCAGYTNGSAVCDGDSGGGLVFQIGELWHVMGIVSVGLGVDFSNGEKKCDSQSYTLYTRVSRHIIWIRQIILALHLKRPFASCDDKLYSQSRNRRDSLHLIV